MTGALRNPTTVSERGAPPSTGGAGPEPPAPPGRVIVERLEDSRHYTTLEAWQLADALAGAAVRRGEALELATLSPSAMVLYHAIQAHGRTETATWPSNARLAEAMGVRVRQVQKLLAGLEELGWVTRSLADGREGRPLILGRDGLPVRVLTCHRTRAAGCAYVARTLDEARERPGPPLSSEDTGGVSSEDTGEVSPEDTGGASPEDAALPSDETPSREPPSPSPEPPKGGACALFELDAAIGETLETEDWLELLARDLLELYPHGVMPTGRLRKPGRRKVIARVRAIFRAAAPSGSLARLGRPAREALAERLRSAARAEAKVAPGLRDEARRFIPGLDVWLNDGGWETPPETVGDLEAERRAEAERAKLIEQEERMSRDIDRLGPTRERVERLNYYRRRLGLPPRFEHLDRSADAEELPKATGRFRERMARRDARRDGPGRA